MREEIVSTSTGTEDKTGEVITSIDPGDEREKGEHSNGQKD